MVFFKLQLVMFFEVIRSERKLIETASLHLAHRWYLGYALDEELPDHSSLTRIRQRLGIAVFARFFEQIVDLCQETGLVWGRELYFDATKVQAKADLDSLVPRFYHEAKAHLADVFADELAASDGQAEAPGAQESTRRWKLLEERRLDQHRGRIVHRSFYADYLDRGRGYQATGAYKKAMRKRKVWVEPLFAEAKEWHGLRRLRLRGLMNANIRGLLIAAGQNLKRLLSRWGWGTASVPNGSGRHRPSGAPTPASPGAVSARDQPDQRGLRRGSAPDLPFFNGLGRVCDSSRRLLALFNT